MKIYHLLMALLLCASLAQAQNLAGDATVSVGSPTVTRVEEGKRIAQNVTLASSVASYTLTYDIVELKDDPTRATSTWWAHTIGYVALGLTGPSRTGWYWQGFLKWTFDDLNIQDYRARFRVVREYGQDAMVEYVWDTPKAKAIARFAITSGSDKLLFFGGYEPKEEIKEVKLRLMAYPATFSKPWERSATTAVRTLTSGGGIPLDLEKERWVLLEDTHPDRPGGGSAGLLLGDASAFSKVTLDGVGGYGEYVNLFLKPDRREFAIGLYEFPSLPDPHETRAYFRRSADAESDALAKLARSDLDKPLEPLPVDRDRAAKIARRDEERLERPAETWRHDPTPLDFRWASRLKGPPVRVALLSARWRAYETMELARRLKMSVKHLYFDTTNAIAQASAWPYRNQTGIGSLGVGVAERQALRICSDKSQDVILIAGLHGNAFSPRLRSVILEQVRSGKGLMLTGDASALSGWPRELTANLDDSLIESALTSLPWESIPGLRKGERGRIGGDAPLKGYRYGKGRVIVFKAKLGTYSSLIPLSNASEGLDGATDRLLALHALAMLAAAGRELPARINLVSPKTPIKAAAAAELVLQVEGSDFADALIRIQDDHDVVLMLETRKLNNDDPTLTLPPLPAMRDYFVDVMLRDGEKNCLGYASTLLRANPERTIESVRLSPSGLVHKDAVPMVDLVNGGTLTCQARIAPAPGEEELSVLWEVRDCFNRLLARAKTPVAANGVSSSELLISHPVTVCHQLDTVLLAGDRRLAVRRDRFTIPIPYPYDDFTFLMWSYAGGEPVLRRENRLCYEMGADMMDICHMHGYSDEGAAREYAVAARSGLRLIPYVSRIAMSATEDNALKPGLFNPDWIEGERASIQRCSRQAAPYKPAAYTLGDENYLCRGRFEVCTAPETMAEFRSQLKGRYKTSDALNAVWKTHYRSSEEIQKPMLLDEAAAQTESFAAWFDFRDFMDTAFALTHERLAGFVREEDPGAKVGWDGFLGYHWQAGYDFYKLTRNLELNQVYSSHFLQTELVRSLKRPDALTGEWGNAIADKEDGFSAIGWHNLFKGHNSCWWWTSWGCDYIPFNPDTSVSKMGEWYFKAADEIRSGPGKLLVHAKRDHSKIAILYCQADLFAAKLVSRLAPKARFAGDGAFLDNHRGLLRGLQDLGYQYKYVSAAQLQSDPSCLGEYRLLFLPFATCLSDEQVAAIIAFANEGGMVIADGRVGMLSGNGVVRAERPLDGLFGVESQAGFAAFSESSVAVEVSLKGVAVPTHVLEPGLKLTTGKAGFTAGGAPLMITNHFGKGKAAMTNFPFRLINRLRSEKKEWPALAMLGELISEAGPRPYSRLMTQNGPARCIEQSLFTEGNLRYLCLEQDILLRGLPIQKARLALDSAAFIYDVRAGKQIAEGKINSWDVELSRGRPQMFALLPYRVVRVEAEARERIRVGETLSFNVRVDATPGETQFHVVHVDVYAPGAERPHRQYSQSIECPGGEGRASIPFALNDPKGVWRLEFKDVASGVKKAVTVKIGD